MSLYIADASIVAKWFLPEPHTEAAWRLCHPNYPLHVPALFDLEFSNIVCKKIRRREISLEEGIEMRQSIIKIPMHRHPDNLLLPLALAIGLEGCMVTADQRFYNTIREEPFRQYLLWVEDLP